MTFQCNQLRLGLEQGKFVHGVGPERNWNEESHQAFCREQSGAVTAMITKDRTRMVTIPVKVTRGGLQSVKKKASERGPPTRPKPSPSRSQGRMGGPRG